VKSRTLAGAASERGSILITAGIIIVAFALLGGAVLEVGSWFIHRRHLQVQTDAAALAAAPYFEDCILDPSGATALPDMTRVANEYGHFNGSTANFNVGFNGTGSTGGTVASNYNRLAYPSGSTHPPDPATDFADNANPCAGNLFDVKATETGIQHLFNFSPLAQVNAHSRVEIFEINEEKGLLPIGVPDPRFQYAFASFIDESTGNPISGCTISNPDPLDNAAGCEFRLFPNGIDPGTGNQLWDPGTGHLVSVPISTRDIGVRIRLVGAKDPNLPCGQTFTECYTDPTATNQGIVYVRGWDPTALPTAAPTVHNAWLLAGSGSTACAPDAYFATSDCSAGFQAEIDFGDRPLSGSGVTASVTATIAGGTTIPLTDSGPVGGTTHLWTANTGLNIVGAGAHAVTLTWNWSQTSGTWRGNTCKTGGNNPCKGSGDLESGNPVQRAFEGSFDQSGPLERVQVFEPGVSTSGADSFQRGTTHSLGVSIAAIGALKAQVQANDPLIQLRVVGGSQNRTVDCDPAFPNLRDEIVNGCGPTYIKNPSFDCSAYNNIPALWGSPQPWPCVAVQTGGSVGQVEQGLQDRILGGANTCTAPIHWPYDEAQYPNDPRVFNLLITPFGTFTGQGSDVVPVLDFGAFYVMGWDNDPCPGATTNVPKGDIVGHFIHFLDLKGNTPSTTHCFFNDPTQITPCVAILTR
jgi:Putative Flp pilus-assembly TadE/G-like